MPPRLFVACCLLLGCSHYLPAFFMTLLMSMLPLPAPHLLLAFSAAPGGAPRGCRCLYARLHLLQGVYQYARAVLEESTYMGGRTHSLAKNGCDQTRRAALAEASPG